MLAVGCKNYTEWQVIYVQCTAI